VERRHVNDGRVRRVVLLHRLIIPHSAAFLRPAPRVAVRIALFLRGRA